MFPVTDMGLLNVVSCTQARGGVPVFGSVQCISNLCNALYISFCDETHTCSRGVSGVGESEDAPGAFPSSQPAYRTHS